MRFNRDDYHALLNDVRAARIEELRASTVLGSLPEVDSSDPATAELWEKARKAKATAIVEHTAARNRLRFFERDHQLNAYSYVDNS